MHDKLENYLVYEDCSRGTYDACSHNMHVTIYI